MGGLLDTIGSALRYGVPAAATARASYLSGQEQETDKQNATQRQSLIDQMERKLKESQVDRNERDPGDQWGQPFDTEQGLMRQNRRNGVIEPAVIGKPTTTTTTPGTRTAGPGSGPGSGAGAGTAGNDAKPQGPGPSAPSSPDHREPVRPIDDNMGGRTSDADEGTNAIAGTLPKSPTLLDRMADAMGGQQSPATAQPAPGGSLIDRMGAAMPSAAPTQPTGVLRRPAKTTAHVTHANTINPTTGDVEDVYSDGSRKVIRKATDVEMGKVNAKTAPKMERSGSGYVAWDATKGEWTNSGVAAPDAASRSPEVLAARRQTEILRRAQTLMKPHQDPKFKFKNLPGLDQDAAMTQAAGEYDAASRAAGGTTGTTPIGLDQLKGDQKSAAEDAIASIKTNADYERAKKKLGQFGAVWQAIDAAVPTRLKSPTPTNGKSGDVILPPAE